jgi:hypothetical protein
MSDKFSDIEKRIEKFSVRNNRSNIFYANIETLLSLVLPDIPNLKLYLKNEFNYGYNSPVQPTQAGQAKFYDLAIKVLEEASQHFVDKSLKKQLFKKFKLDHFITGRGIFWVDYYTKENEINGQSQEINNVCIDYVHWLNFAMDPKLEWSEVRWVARRMYLDKKKLKRLYPDTDFEDFHFTSNPYVTLQGDDSYVEIETTYLASGGKYAEIWEIWDKFTSKRIIISPQSEERLISVSDVEVDEKYFFSNPRTILINMQRFRFTSDI